MHCTVTHQGVPIGTTDLEPAELAAGVLVPESGYEAIRDDVRAATNALRARGLLAPAFDGPINQAEVERATHLSFELRDNVGAMVPTDWVNVFETPGVDPEHRVLARFIHSGAGMPAQRHQTRLSDPSAASLG